MADHCEFGLRQDSECSSRFNDSDQTGANFRSWPISALLQLCNYATTTHDYRSIMEYEHFQKNTVSTQ